jgi:hypothetical protein
MKTNGCPAVNSERTFFNKHKGTDLIMHCLFADFMLHVSTYDGLCDEFLELYQKDFEIIG